MRSVFFKEENGFTKLNVCEKSPKVVHRDGGCSPFLLQSRVFGITLTGGGLENIYWI